MATRISQRTRRRSLSFCGDSLKYYPRWHFVDAYLEVCVLHTSIRTLENPLIAVNERLPYTTTRVYKLIYGTAHLVLQTRTRRFSRPPLHSPLLAPPRASFPVVARFAPWPRSTMILISLGPSGSDQLLRRPMLGPVVFARFSLCCAFHDEPTRPTLGVSLSHASTKPVGCRCVSERGASPYPRWTREASR